MWLPQDTQDIHRFEGGWYLASSRLPCHWVNREGPWTGDSTVWSIWWRRFWCCCGDSSADHQFSEESPPDGR